MNLNKFLIACLMLLTIGCDTVNTGEVIAVVIPEPKASVSNFWKNATVYFLLADRFNNGDESNDLG